jgi:hypothetical protein
VKTKNKILFILLLQMLFVQQSIFAQESDTIVTPVRHKFKPETMKATMLAVAFPGLGQIYNRKIWKIPVVYAGFGALIYSAGFNSKNYNTYIKAYQDFTDNSPKTVSYMKVITANPDTYDPLLFPKTYSVSNYSFYKDGLLRMVDYYKRYRDLSYIGIAGWYLFSILDANVDASLFNYDVGPNLNLSLAPMQMRLPGGYVGAGLNVDLKVNF